MTTVKPLVFLFCVALLGICNEVQAHDVWAVGNPKQKQDAQINVEDIKKLIAQQSGTDAESKRYVLERATLWLPGQKLRGCFMGGDQAQRSAVITAVRELLDGKGVNIQINFVNGAQTVCQAGANGRYSEEMRVSLQEGCCSAYVGRTSLHPDVITGANIYLEGSPSNATIKHELLHALGFHHEHQKPSNPCAFNYQAIQAAYNWTTEMVKDNFDKLNANSTKYVWSTSFDGESLMKYWFAPQFLVGGTASPCYTPEAATLSTEDWLGLKTAYPMAFDAAGHKTKVNKKGSIDLGANASAGLKDLLSSLPAE